MSDSRLEIILAAKDITGKAFDHVQGRLMALERRVFSLGSALAGFGLGFGITQLASHVEHTAESFEQLEAQLDILYRGNGKQVLEEINAWALDMPINTAKAVEAWVQMRALGIEPTIEKLQALTDVGTIFGDDVLKRIVLQLGQMSAKGKVMSQDLNVLAEAGINARKYLMDAFGMTVDEIQGSGVEIGRVVEVIFKGIERDFGGSAQRMMTSWRGLKETAASYFVEIERRVMDAGLFDAMKAALSDVNAQMKDWLANNDQYLKQRVPEYTNQVIESVKGLYEKTSGLIGLYNSIPEEITGAAGYGIMGRFLFGGWGPFKIIAGATLVNNTFDALGVGLVSLATKHNAAVKASQEFGKVFVEVLSGQRHWWTGEYVEWKRAAEEATDFWARHKKGALEYQADIQQILENDPLNDFFQRNRSQMGYYTSTASKIIRQIGQENAQAAKDAEEAAKEAARAIERSQKAVADAVTDAQKKVWEQVEKELSENSEAGRFRGLSQYIADLKRIREEAKKVYGEAGVMPETPKQAPEAWKQYPTPGEDWISRHREEIGPYDAERTKKTLEEIAKQGQETSDAMIELSQRTAEAMQGNFSDLFFDAMTGELKSFEDYATAVFRSIQRALADIAGQMATEAIFGSKSTGASSGGGGLLSWLGGILGSFGSSSGGSSAAMSQSTALALVKHSGGMVDGSGPTRMIPAWMIANAPRLHNGLASDEYAAVLQHGERVLPKGQTGTTNNVTINVAAPNGRLDRESISQVQAGLFAALSRSARRNN